MKALRPTVAEDVGLGSQISLDKKRTCILTCIQIEKGANYSK
jgi:hypothetical protein